MSQTLLKSSALKILLTHHRRLVMPNGSVRTTMSGLARANLLAQHSSTTSARQQLTRRHLLNNSIKYYSRCLIHTSRVFLFKDNNSNNDDSSSNRSDDQGSDQAPPGSSGGGGGGGASDPPGGGGDGPGSSLPIPSLVALAPLQIPDFLPRVPVIAINRNPLFPFFIKMLEINDKNQIDLIRRKVHLNQPYLGLFVRKEEK